MARPTKRTPETVKKIEASIKDGAFDHIAAGDAGIGRSAFYQWLREDEAFAHTVELARAHARKKAETEVFAQDPKFWLTKGPGKTRPDAEGWTDALAITGADGGPIRSSGPDLSKLDADELRALRDIQVKLDAGDTP